MLFPLTVTYNNRLGCFVFEKQTLKITEEFHKVTSVKPFIDCLISCHTRVVQKNTILRSPIALSFSQLLCRKKDSRKGYCGLYDDIQRWQIYP